MSGNGGSLCLRFGVDSCVCSWGAPQALQRIPRLASPRLYHTAAEQRAIPAKNASLQAVSQPPLPCVPVMELCTYRTSTRAPARTCTLLPSANFRASGMTVHPSRVPVKPAYLLKLHVSSAHVSAPAARMT
jgi:hypothetical protein